MESANLETRLGEAMDHIDKHRVQEAQAAFRDILVTFNENNSEAETSNLSNETFETINQCLVGLADIHLKSGHTQRQDAFTWFHHYLCSIAYMRESLHLCHKNETDAEGWRNCDVTNKRLRIQARLDDITEMFIKHLRYHLVNTNKAGENTINETWLENFVTYICDSFTEKKSSRSCSPVKQQPDLSKAEKLHKKRKDTKERKMDFNKIQKAISKLVRNVTADIRSRYRRKKLSEETLRRSVSCEILTIMSPITDDNELADLFERVIAEDEGEMTPSAELDVEMLSATPSRCSSKRGSTDSLLDDDGAMYMSPRAGAKHGGATRVTSPIEGPNDLTSGAFKAEGSNPSATSQATPTQEKPDITIWKSYIKSPRPNSLSFKQYRLKSFDEMAPLTELNTPDNIAEEEQIEDIENNKVSTTVGAISVQPLSATKLYETLGHMMSKLASLLADEPEVIDCAIELYKYSLGLIHQCAKTSANTTLIAKILKSIGMLKCTKGDLVAGCQLLQEAMQIYKKVSCDDDLSVASVWCELGRAFLLEREHVTSLFNHVMQEVRGEMDVEWREEALEVGSEGDDSEDSSSTGDSYSVHVHEALECMQSALNVLDKLNPQEEDHGQLLVEVLTRLGDCNVVVGDYTKAVEYYEEVLTICKNVTGSTTLENNAHVLLMLGVANFLLGNHPKAVTMLETASILQRHIFNDSQSFEVAFTFTMLGSAFYKMGQYHRCIVWCLKASEPSLTLGDRIESLDYNRSWFLVQTFFTLGYAYYTLEFFDKAIYYLEIGQKMLERCSKTDTKQYVKLLKVLADCRIGQEDYEGALQLYEDATDLAASLGDERSSTALQNQLLNCMAAIQVNTRQYSSAAQYLEQALDHQRAVESSIKGDLIGLQYKLGVTYTLSGEIDKAVDCFEECLETLNEAPGSPGPEAIHSLGRLANLYHVKGLMQEDNGFMDELLEIANTYFTKAMNMDHHASVCVQYANFLTQQGQPADALNILLPFLFGTKVRTDKEVSYSGAEQAILPEHLQNEADDIDTVTLETKVLAYFLGILCFKELKLTKDADDCLEAMYKVVLKSDCYFSSALMGYAFMEMAMYQEAAECFAKAAQLQQDSALPAINCCLCLYLNTYQVITKALKHIIEFYVPADYIRFQKPQSDAKPAIKPNSPAVTHLLRSNAAETRSLENRDSGYFEHEKVPSLSSSPNTSAMSTSTMPSSTLSSAEKRYHSNEASFISSHESDSSYLTDQSMMSDDRGFNNSSDSLPRMDTSRTDDSEDVEIWETIDEKGNVISSTIYEVVENDNGNYQESTLTTNTTTNTPYTTNERTHSRSSTSTEDYNENYRRLYESVQTALNERWVNVDLLDNDTLEKLRDAGFVPPPQSPPAPQKSVSRFDESPTKRRFIDNVSVNNRYASNSNYMNTPGGGGKEEMALQIEAEYPQHEEEEEMVEEVWEVFEETVDTPPEILALLAKQNV